MTEADQYERQMLALINEERTLRGLDPVQLEQNLNESAEVHSLWMLRTDDFSHTGAGGSTATQRMRDAGFDLSGSWGTAENLAVQTLRGAPGIADDVEDLHESLMNSPGHRANILNPDLEYVGIGIEVGNYDYGNGERQSVIVTQNFAYTGGMVDLDPSEQGSGSGGGSGSSGPMVWEDNTQQADPVVTGALNDPERGGASNDRLFGNGGRDQLFGRDGSDVLGGREGDDRLFGGGGDDQLYGNAGHDVLSGEAGQDRLFGGDGHDSIYGGSATDVLSGGNGDDRLFGEGSADLVLGGAGNDLLSGDDGRDRLFGGTGNDRLLGGAEGDVLNGQAGDDILEGGAGADLIVGAEGHDQLDGGDGADRLIGGAGGDRLDAGGGRGDVLIGGDGADSFVFRVTDASMDVAVVADFEAGIDQIDLRGIDANETRAGNQGFRQVDSLSGAAGEVQVFEFGSSTFIRGDVDGGGADFLIRLSGTVGADGLDAGDILF